MTQTADASDASTAADAQPVVPDGSAVVRCRGVSKNYGKFTALHPIDLDIAPGEIFGFLGPNGAGKTTLIKILLGLASATTGDIQIFGRDLFSQRNTIMREVGAVVEAPVFFDYLTAWENLQALVSLSGGVDKETIERTLHRVGLGHARDKKVGTFSYGMKQRLGIAQALLPRSRFLILDEPTNGLDPHGIAGMRALVIKLARETGLTVFVSSHMLVEVEAMCDRVVIIDHGKKVLEGQVADLKRREGEITVRLRPSANLDAAIAALGFPEISRVDEPDTGLIAVHLQVDPTLGAPELTRRLVAQDLQVESILPMQRTLEDVFLSHTGADEHDHRIDAFRD